MDKQRLMELAGVEREDTEVLYIQLLEFVQLPDPEDITVEDLTRRLEHCKRAMSLANKLPDPADRKKWLSACFTNLNAVSDALKRMISAQPDADIKPAKVKQAYAPETGTNPPQLRSPSL